MTHKYRKKLKSAEGFSCSLCVFYGGLGIRNCNFLSKKYPIFSNSKFFSMFGHQSLDSELDPDPDPQQQPLLEKSVQPSLAGFHQ